jgi:uncharacterized RDD family membrane protein YckC
MENNFDNVMSKKTNEELIKIVTTDFSKYKLEAVESAKKEIELRNIDTSKFQEIVEKVNIEKQTQDKFDESIVSSTLRFVHFIVDFISFFIIYFILTSFVMLVFNIDSNKSILPFWFLMIISFLLNYAFMEHKFQKTVGKFITRTKVVNLNGEKPTLNDIMVRTFCRLIPFDRLSFFFAKNGFHDGISNTRVIKD